MRTVALHKISASVVQMNNVTSITLSGDTIIVTGVLATQTVTTTQYFPRNTWIVRIIES